MQRQNHILNILKDLVAHRAFEVIPLTRLHVGSCSSLGLSQVSCWSVNSYQVTAVSQILSGYPCWQSLNEWALKLSDLC